MRLPYGLFRYMSSLYGGSVVNGTLQLTVVNTK